MSFLTISTIDGLGGSIFQRLDIDIENKQISSFNKTKLKRLKLNTSGFTID